MTDEADKTGRPVKTALILCAMLLSALALVAGCKSSPSKVGYLRVVDVHAVQFIQVVP